MRADVRDDVHNAIVVEAGGVARRASLGYANPNQHLDPVGFAGR